MNPAATLSKKILQKAIEAEASDIHFYPYEDETDIYFRIHGNRTFFKTIPKSHYSILMTYFKFASEMDIGETRRPQNGTMIHRKNYSPYSLRLSTLPVNESESLTIRILPQQANYSLNRLFLFPYQLQKMKTWVEHKAGIILLTGPTGSGKTTTLYALLEFLLKERSYQTITLEDPVEKKIEQILQVQINEKAGVTYQTALKAALRHDPDIIMIGEIRDRYTAQFAFEAALTGHLIFSTLHAKNAIGTIYRLMELGVQRHDLKQTLIAICALELLPVNLKNQMLRRAAIMEQLDGHVLEQCLDEKTQFQGIDFQSFNHLRKKAYAYGYISKEAFQQSKKQIKKRSPN